MKTDKGEARQPGGLSDQGEPYQGVPRRTQSCTQRTNNNRASKRNEQRFDSLARFHFDLFNAENPTGPLTLSRGHRSPARGARPRRHGSGDTPPLARLFAPDKSGVRHAAISPKLRPRVSRGRPAGRLFHFLGCARGATSKISLSAESDSGALPLRTLPAF